MDEMEVEGMKGNIRHKVENGAPFKVLDVLKKSRKR